MSSIKIFFSLPFTPLMNRTRFYNGHLALAVDGTVYQIFNPRMLKSSFLVSIMPLEKWLYGADKKWCCNNRLDKNFSSVYLYGKGESCRTKIYQIEIACSHSDALKIVQKFLLLEREYQCGSCNFNLYSCNCASVVYEALQDFLALKNMFFRFIPAFAFRYILGQLKKQHIAYTFTIIPQKCGTTFRLHKFCIGIFSFYPQTCLDVLG
jgi:hypothetical protein